MKLITLYFNFNGYMYPVSGLEGQQDGLWDSRIGRENDNHCYCRR